MGIRGGGGGVKAGSMIDYAGGTVPAGWLLCYGQAISRADYAGLFLAIGVAFGVGDGSTTFNLPDTRGRAVFGKDDMGGVPANRLTNAISGINGTALGAVGGGESVTLTSAEMPTHLHGPGTGSFMKSGINGGIVASAGSSATYSGGNTGNAGSSGEHRNVPPAIVANKIIKF